MARKKKDENGNGKKQKQEPIEAQLIDADNEAKLAEQKETEAALKPYQEFLPEHVDEEVYASFVNTRNRQIATNIFESGCAILVMREHLRQTGGDFEHWVENYLECSRQWAYRQMEVARRFAHLPKIRNAIKSPSKLLAIDIPDKDLQEIERTEKIADKPIDELDTMTVNEIKELRDKYQRRHTETKQQVEELRREKADLEQQIHDWQEGGSDDQRVNEWINDLEKKMQAVIAIIENINDQVGACNLYTRKRFVGFVATTFDQVEELNTRVYADQGIHAGALVKDGFYRPPDFDKPLKEQTDEREE